MDFILTDEQKMVRETVRNFAISEIKPMVAKMEETGEFPHEIIKKASQLGLCGIKIPVEFGGGGMDAISYIIAIEEICKISASVGVILSVNNSLVCDNIYHYGNDEQKKKYLIPLAKGELLGCFALTEADAGSDAGSIRTSAKKEGGYYILDGTKVFTTNGVNAQVAIVFAVTDKEKGKKGISAFIVEKGTSGFSVGREEEKMGLKGSETVELIFDNCKISKENILGKEGDGFKIALSTLDSGRIGIAAQSIGIASACFEEALKYSKERVQFGKPISEFQAIKWMIADMSTEIEAARVLAFRAAYLKDSKERFTKEAAQAKLYASEMVNRVAYRAGQIFGGYGYCKEYSVERFYRDARVTTLYEGTSEIQRLVIARELLR
ncbi:MAG: acyl-CoA dehydrogenase [Candidatus Scalinduaceae bacterium]